LNKRFVGFRLWLKKNQNIGYKCIFNVSKRMAGLFVHGFNSFGRI